tara:strand:+ start:358 stop:540 length:183 start_codon:yes stop_codon:yes gene_type:complete
MAELKYDKLVNSLKDITDQLETIDIDTRMQDSKVRKALKRLFQDRQRWLLKQIKSETEKL